MTITLTERSGPCHFANRTVVVCVLKDEMMRAVNMIVCDTEFDLTLGRPDDPAGTAKAIREVIASLKLDDPLEGPHKQRPPNKPFD